MTQATNQPDAIILILLVWLDSHFGIFIFLTINLSEKNI